MIGNILLHYTNESGAIDVSDQLVLVTYVNETEK